MIIRLHTAWLFVDRLNMIQPDRNKRVTYWLERKTIQKADVVTSPAQAMVDLTETWLPLQDKQIHVVPNPVNSVTFAPRDMQRRQEILFVGRLERRKGIQTLVQALPHVLRRCSEATIRFVGTDGTDPSGQSWRECLIEGLKPSERARVYFEQVPRDALIDRYRQAAICVMPSVWENFPYGLLEAMACGMPVVATRAGGLPELVEDGFTGRLVPPECPLDLTDALCELLEHSAWCAEFGRNARKRVEECFSVERVVPRMLEVYEAVLNAS